LISAVGRVVVVMVGAGFTGTISDALTLLDATEVAVIVAVMADVKVAGATYVADVLVWPVRLPPPLTLQVTP